MVDITAALVKQLRDATNVSMMECKRALVETDGDMEQAARLLREKGIAVAAKKASREANQGLIDVASADGGRTVSMVEVNCETDFVARNATFVAFVASLAERACATDGALSEEAKEEITAKVAEIGENIVVRHNVRYLQEGSGKIGSYVHLNSKVGVLLDLGCGKPETAETETFVQLLKDLTLHVAACNPRYLADGEVPEEEVASERAIYAKQVENKPEHVIEKIVDGKIRKYFAEVCLVDQGFVKEPKQAVKALLAEKGKELDDSLTIRRFIRYQIGG